MPFFDPTQGRLRIDPARFPCFNLVTAQPPTSRRRSPAHQPPTWPSLLVVLCPFGFASSAGGSAPSSRAVDTLCSPTHSSPIPAGPSFQAISFCFSLRFRLLLCALWTPSAVALPFCVMASLPFDLLCCANSLLLFCSHLIILPDRLIV